MPSQALQGLTTESGWKIDQIITDKLGSGGNFCTRYLAVSPNGEKGFLKAMDLANTLDDIGLLQSTVNQYVFEQDILQVCKDRRLTRVVIPLDAGKIVVPNFNPPSNIVYYVIFEKADGDLRKNHFDVDDKRWVAALKALHHVALGIEQLHLIGIAHQDVKPSNVLSFKNDEFKVSDLGRVVDRAGSSPFSQTHFPGDHSYKPIEMFFNVTSLDFHVRESCDMYMVGSLIYHMIEGVNINSRLRSEAFLLDPAINQRPYTEALPYLLSAYRTVLDRYKKQCETIFGEKIAQGLYDIVFEMCHPNFDRRGNPKLGSKVGQYSIRRYVSKLSNLIKVAEYSGI